MSTSVYYDAHDRSGIIVFCLLFRMKQHASAGHVCRSRHTRRPDLSRERREREREIEREREREEEICRHCDLQLIDEHFLMICPNYLHVREEHSPRFLER